MGGKIFMESHARYHLKPSLSEDMDCSKSGLYLQSLKWGEIKDIVVIILEIYI